MKAYLGYCMNTTRLIFLALTVIAFQINASALKVKRYRYITSPLALQSPLLEELGPNAIKYSGHTVTLPGTEDPVPMLAVLINPQLFNICDEGSAAANSAKLSDDGWIQAKDNLKLHELVAVPVSGGKSNSNKYVLGFVLGSIKQHNGKPWVYAAGKNVYLSDNDIYKYEKGEIVAKETSNEVAEDVKKDS